MIFKTTEWQRRGAIRVGTRGSDLARMQTRLVAEALSACGSDIELEVRIIRTAGDERGASQVILPSTGGRKGLFTRELERALVAGEIDLAVHSAKDLPSELADGTEIVATLKRAPVDDVLIATTPCNLQSLPSGGIVATGSVRRKHQLRWKRPDLEIANLSGNVPTRLRKLTDARWHAIILARAGLERLGMDVLSGHIRLENSEFPVALLPREIFLPAGGQGIIAIQARSSDGELKRALDPINDEATARCLRAERAFLRLLNADCNQPVGVLAVVEAKSMTVRAQLFDPGATTPHQATVGGPSEQAEQLAEKLMQQIRAK